MPLKDHDNIIAKVFQREHIYIYGQIGNCGESILNNFYQSSVSQHILTQEKICEKSVFIVKKYLVFVYSPKKVKPFISG